MDLLRSAVAFFTPFPTKASDLYRPAAAGGAPGWTDFDSSDNESSNQPSTLVRMSRQDVSLVSSPKSWWKHAEGLGAGNNRSTRSHPQLNDREIKQILKVEMEEAKPKFLVLWKNGNEEKSWVDSSDPRLAKAMIESFQLEQEKQALAESRDTAQNFSRSTRSRQYPSMPMNANKKQEVVQVPDEYDYGSQDEVDSSFKKGRNMGTRRQTAKENLNNKLVQYEACRRKKLNRELKKSGRESIQEIYSPIEIKESSDEDVMEETHESVKSKHRSVSLDSPFKRMKMSPSSSASSSNKEPKSDSKPKVQEKKAPSRRKGKNNGSSSNQTHLSQYFSSTSTSEMSRKAEHILDRGGKDISRPAEKAMPRQTYDLTSDADDEDDPSKIDLLDSCVVANEDAGIELNDSALEVQQEQDVVVEEKEPPKKGVVIHIMDGDSRPPGFDEGSQEVEQISVFETDKHRAGAFFFVQYKGEPHVRLMTKELFFVWQPDYVEHMEKFLESLKKTSHLIKEGEEQSSSVEEKKEESEEEWEEVQLKLEETASPVEK